MILISFTPLPKISGTKIATTPQMSAAIKVCTKGGKPVFAATAADLNNASINSIAMIQILTHLPIKPAPSATNQLLRHSAQTMARRQK